MAKISDILYGGNVTVVLCKLIIFVCLFLQICNANAAEQVAEVSQKYVFISFSMPDAALLELIKQAKVEKFTPIMRGFKEGSYKKTAEALQQIINETGYGVGIDPEIFKEFDIKAVPTFVYAVERAKPCLANTTCFARKHYKLSGNVTVKYASEKLLKAAEEEVYRK